MRATCPGHGCCVALRALGEAPTSVGSVPLAKRRPRSDLLDLFGCCVALRALGEAPTSVGSVGSVICCSDLLLSDLFEPMCDLGAFEVQP